MSERLVTVATFGGSFEANLAKNRLESAGIGACLADQEAVGMVGYLTNAFGGVKLQVAERDSHDAIAILAETAVAEAPPAGEPTESPSPGESQQWAPPDTEPEEETEPASTPREENADRAWRGSLLGVLVPPLQFYVFWLLIKVLLSKDRLELRRRRRAIGAALINLPLMIIFCVIVAWPWLGIGRPDHAGAVASFERGETAFQAGDLKQAQRHYRRAIELDPEYADAQLRLGELYDQCGQYDTAIWHLSRAIDLDRDQIEAYRLRGRAYRHKGDVISALADHHEAIRRSPDDSRSYLDRAEDYEAIGENERALSDCNEAIRLEPSRRAYTARASLYRSLGDDEKAELDDEAARQYAE